MQQIKASDAQAVIMISVNKSTAAFVKRYRERAAALSCTTSRWSIPAEMVSWPA